MSARKDVDLELFTRIRSGDQLALDRLLREYSPKLLSFAASILESEDLAQDVVQEVFVNLWDSRAQIHIQNSVASYLFRAVRNRALNMKKRESAYLSLHSHDIGDVGGEEPQFGDAADAQLLSSEFATDLERALNTLSPRLREIFLLRAEHGLSYSEIAETLGVAVRSVHVQMYRATRALGEKLRLWSDWKS